MSTSIRELKEAHAKLENELRQKLQAFEEEHGVEVDRVRLETHTMADGSTEISNIEVEVSL